MRRHPLAARHALIVAPHPDDEAIGAWALMRRLRRRGASVELVVVSDGAASHPGSRVWPPARLVAERRREVRRAMAALPIGPRAIRFLDLPDGMLGHDEARLTRALGRALACRRRPDLVVGPVAGDAHPDHRAVALALARIRPRGERRLGYQVWPEGGRGSAHGFRVALDGVGCCRKRRIVRGYRTQAGLVTDAEAGFAMTARHLRAFVRPQEHFAWLA